jgi:Dolichyl-phosphate-mannose-protein mannosyltransferase
VVIADGLPQSEADGVRRRSIANLDARVLLAGIVLLAVVVRLAGIGSRLSIDDAYSWFAAASPSAHVFLHRLAAYENTPPLSYLLLMLVPNDQPAWLRVPAAVPGVLLCVLLYYALRPRLGDRASLLGALGLAVSPYLITYSNLARGFMLADAALLVVLWAVLSLSERETTAKWATFIVAGSVAVYTEYASAIFLVALVLAVLWVGRPRRRTTVLAGGLALLTLAPWIPQIVRAQDQVGVTKFTPLFATPSLTGLRDIPITLALGEKGGTINPAGRWLEFAMMVALAIAAAVVLRRGWDIREERGRRAIRLLAATAALTFAGYALAALVGIDVFTQRYLTSLIPLGAGLGAAALASIGGRWPMIAVSSLLVALGLVGIARRIGAEWEPDLTPVRIAANAVHPRTVLTNTPVVLYYLRSLDPRFDRPANLGPGGSGTCARPCLVIDDTRIGGGTPRQVVGSQSRIGPFLLTLER